MVTTTIQSADALKRAAKQVDRFPPSPLSSPLRKMALRFDGLNPKPGGMATINSARFGMTRNGGTTPHQGIDLEADVGTPVFAIADGWITFSGLTNGKYGKIVILGFKPAQAWLKYLTSIGIKDSDGVLYALYAHLETAPAQSGPVKRGKTIGTVGVSGNGDQSYPHLHFEICQIPEFKSGLNYRLNSELFFPVDISKPIEALLRANKTA